MSLSRIGRRSRASRQDVAWKRGRMSLHAFLRIKTSPPCLPKRCPVVARRDLTGLQRDDVQVGAGDGTRTRDSPLGRQELYRLSYSRVMSLPEASPCFGSAGAAS